MDTSRELRPTLEEVYYLRDCQTDYLVTLIRDWDSMGHDPRVPIWVNFLWLNPHPHIEWRECVPSGMVRPFVDQHPLMNNPVLTWVTGEIPALIAESFQHSDTKEARC